MFAFDGLLTRRERGGAVGARLLARRPVAAGRGADLQGGLPAPVPTQAFFNSIVPCWRVLVKVQMMWSPELTGTLLLAPGLTVGSLPSLIPLLAVPPPAPLSLKQASALS